jgi:hypothetical protein
MLGALVTPVAHPDEATAANRTNAMMARFPIGRRYAFW